MNYEEGEGGEWTAKRSLSLPVTAQAPSSNCTISDYISRISKNFEYLRFNVRHKMIGR